MTNMRIIHCADLHLDSKMTANLSEDKAKMRKTELLHTFQRMIEYAKENQVEAILIAGDLFDTHNISATARNTVYQAISGNPQIDFYYLKGNHDVESFLGNLDEIPGNLKLFANHWTSYEADEAGLITISGVELQKGNAAYIYETLNLHPEKFNLVMLHGQEMEYEGKDKTEVISLRKLKNRGIDYLALGHVHEYKEGILDSRGTWCYPGCLEGRGFDECGEHGFVLLDIDAKGGTFIRQFVPIAYRSLYTLEVDVTGCLHTASVLERIKSALFHAAYDSKCLLKIVLTGAVDVSCEIHGELLTRQLRDNFYSLKISNETKYKVDYQSFLFDESLKGEFVRGVMADSTLEESEKAAIIRYGIQALAGEEIE